MTFLILSEDENFVSELKKEIKTNEKAAKIVVSDFSEKKLLSIKKKLSDFSACIIHTNQSGDKNIELVSFLGNIIGYLIANETPLITNDRFLAFHSIFSSKEITFYQNDNQIIKHISKQYSNIIDIDNSRIAKKELFLKGIPFTPDCFATYMQKNKEDICNLFLKGGIDVNSRDDLGTPLLNIAVRNDNESFVKKLISLGADINQISEDRGYTAVMDAVWRGNYDITKLLVESGAELNTINKEGQNNLVLAVGADRNKICELLVKNGADPDVKDQMGMSAYGYASLFRKTEILEILKPYHKE